MTGKVAACSVPPLIEPDTLRPTRSGLPVKVSSDINLTIWVLLEKYIVCNGSSGAPGLRKL